MNTKRQEVKYYSSIYDAYDGIKIYLSQGWYVCACASAEDKVLIIYEKELQTWN